MGCGHGLETPGCAVHPLQDRLVWMKIETPLAPSKGMEKRGPGRVNCCPLKDINAYAGGSSLFLLWCCPALPIFYMNESVKWQINQSCSCSTNCLIQSACFNKTWVKGKSLKGSLAWRPGVEAREMVHSKVSRDYRGPCRKQHMKQLSLMEI